MGVKAHRAGDPAIPAGTLTSAPPSGLIPLRGTEPSILVVFLSGVLGVDRRRLGSPAMGSVTAADRALVVLLELDSAVLDLEAFPDHPPDLLQNLRSIPALDARVHRK